MVNTPNSGSRLSDDKEFQFDKLDEAYHKIEDCFDPLSVAVVDLKAAGLAPLSHQVQSALDTLQVAQDVVREARRSLREDNTADAQDKK